MRQLEAVRERATRVYAGAASEPNDDQQDRLPIAIEELRTALEELQVAEDELRQQNQELVATRHQVERERQRYQDLFSFAPDAYFITDSLGTIKEANRAAGMLLNISPKYLVGKPLRAFFPEEERTALSSHLSRLQELDRIAEWEVHLCPRYSARVDVAITVAIVRDQKGSPLALRWLVRDITARKQAETQIRNMQLQNLQLVEESRLKSQFLRIMSHELRTPLNAVIGFSQVLLRQLQHQLASPQAIMIERILSNGKNLLALINDILDFSKIEAGSFEIELSEFDLAELVKGTTEDLRSLAEHKHLDLKVSSALQNPQIVNDKNRLRQILVNLLSNAIKFTGSGSVCVEVWELSEERLAIAVKDTGIGIAEADMKHIFKEFRQLNQNDTRQYGGTGLGLAITKSLVDLMKGKITVSSQLAHGSTFRVELPRCVSSDQ
jgi:PAS domain S-box-containing protein